MIKAVYQIKWITGRVTTRKSRFITVETFMLYELREKMSRIEQIKLLTYQED